MANEPEPLQRSSRRTLQPEQREEAYKMLCAGTKISDVAKQFGVTRQAISSMRMRREDKRNAVGFGQLTEDELAELKSLLQNTLPMDHDFIRNHGQYKDTWTIKRAYRFAEYHFKRSLRYRFLSKHLQEWLPDENWQPPKPGDADYDAELERDLRWFDGALLKDKKFIEFLRSPMARQIRSREFTLQRAMYERTLAGEAAQAAEDIPETPAPTSPRAKPLAAPLLRIGKHKGSKGSPFTKKKKKKKR